MPSCRPGQRERLFSLAMSRHERVALRRLSGMGLVWDRRCSERIRYRANGAALGEYRD